MNWKPIINEVVVPVDFSKESVAALQVGLTMVDTPSHLHAIHVVQTELVTEFGLPLRERAPQALDEFLRDRELSHVSQTVAFGDPGSEIARFAEEQDVDLIVIPSHGRTGVKRWLIGSVAERVVRLAHCPVLVLRSDHNP